MKRFMGIVLLILLQLGTAVGWLAYGDGECASGDMENWEQILKLSPEECRMQENLAMWYNLNLKNDGEGQALEGYGEIFFLEDGLMCAVEFPQGQKILPVWHGTRGKQDWGLTHLSRSSLPVGGYGNHTLLTCGEDVMEGLDFPHKGEQFRVYALGACMTYRIFDVETTKKDPTLPGFEKDRDLCSIWIRRGMSWVIIRGVRDENGV